MPGNHDVESRLAELEDEHEQHIRAVELAAQFAQECPSIFRWGDGEGGYFLGLVRDELRRNGEYESERPRKRLRKQIPTNRRIEVYRRDDFKCVQCGSEKDIQIDHIHPVRVAAMNYRTCKHYAGSAT